MDVVWRDRKPREALDEDAAGAGAAGAGAADVKERSTRLDCRSRTMAVDVQVCRRHEMWKRLVECGGSRL